MLNNYRIGPLSYGAYLDSEEISELRKYHREQIKNTRPGCYFGEWSDGRRVFGRVFVDRCEELPGCGIRARVYKGETAAILCSYFTTVAAITTGGRLVRLWDNWSKTTAGHVAKLCKAHNIPAPSKKEWNALPVCVIRENGFMDPETGEYIPA